MKSVNQTKKAEIKRMEKRMKLLSGDSLFTYRIFVQIKIPNYVHFDADSFVNEIFVFFFCFAPEFSILAFYSPSLSLPLSVAKCEMLYECQIQLFRQLFVFINTTVSSGTVFSR